MTTKILSPLKAIKKRCKDECCCGDLKSWRECACDCALRPFRFGKNPYHKLSSLNRLKKSMENLRPFAKNKPLQTRNETQSAELETNQEASAETPSPSQSNEAENG